MRGVTTEALFGAAQSFNRYLPFAAALAARFIVADRHNYKASEVYKIAQLM